MDKASRPVNQCARTIYTSTACLEAPQPLAERLALYRAVGLNAIELGANVTVSTEVLASLERTDPPFLVHNYFPPPAESFVLNLASSDASIRARSLDLVMDGLDLAARLGAPFYSVHAGFVTDPIGFGTTSFLFPPPKSLAETQQANARFVQNLTVAAKYAQERNIEILIENNVCPTNLRGNLLLQTADELLALFAQVADLPIGMLLDTGHLKVTASTFGFDVQTFVSSLAPFVRCVHIHDNDGVSDLHWPVESDSWVLEILQRPAFAHLPFVIESKFATVEHILQNIELLHDQLTQSAKSPSSPA